MSDLTMNIPTEVVERAVRDKINAAIASQLGNPQVLIQKLVNSALSQKVNVNGIRTDRDYENKYEFLELTAGKFVREAAQEALREYFEENKALIKEAVKKEVAKSPSKMAKVFMDGVTRSMQSNYSTKIDISFNTPK